MIRPVREHLLIKIEQSTQKTTSSGILLKTESNKRQCIGTVVAVGDGRLLGDGKRLAPLVRAGDQIIFYDFAGVKVEPESTSEIIYLLIKENDVLAIIEE